MNVGVLALQGDVSEHRAALADLGVRAVPVRQPEDLSTVDGIVLPGGESTTMSMLLDSSGLAEPLSKALVGGMPAFGTCAGMILLASSVVDGRPDQMSFGAIDLTVRRNAYGSQLASFECDLSVAGLPEGPVHAVFIRAPVVESVGEDVEVLARLVPFSAAPGDPIASGGADGERERPVLCRQGTVLVAAFHPELTSDRRLHGLFVEMIEKRGR